MSMMVLEGWQFRLAKELPIFDSVKVALARARLRLGVRVRVRVRVRSSPASTASRSPWAEASP